MPKHRKQKDVHPSSQYADGGNFALCQLVDKLPRLKPTKFIQVVQAQICDLRSQSADLISLISDLISQIPDLRSHISDPRSQISYLRSRFQISGLRSEI